jgi:hypothetical protein
MSSTNISNNPDLSTGVRPRTEPLGESPDAKEQARQVADTAKDEGQRVAGVAKEEAQSVVREAGQQARGLLDDATSQVEAQSKQQKDRLTEVVRTFGDDLHSMASHGEGTDGLASQLVQQAADQARTVASHLEDREPRELLDDVRRFAQRRPGSFLLGALVAGVVVGRVTRGAKDAPAAQETAPGEPGPSLSPTSSDLRTGVSSPETTDLGPKAVEMSESGFVGPDGGRS